MLIGVIADDFTGASDIANTLAKGLAPEGGLRTTQYPGVPTVEAESSVEAGVISLKSRTSPVAEAVTDSLQALDWLLTQGCKQILFKYCSTFDSTKTGNIGPVAEALAEALNVKGVVACPAFPTMGRTVFQGHLFVNDQLLSQSGLQYHPLTPMTDPDIRRWLQYQCQHPVGHLSHATISNGVGEVRKSLAMSAEKDQTLVVTDAVSNEDLITLGEALIDAPLVTGASGIALGLPKSLIQRGLASGEKLQSMAITGPEAILAGSCSGATLDQIEFHEKHHPTLAIDVESVLLGQTSTEQLVSFIVENEGNAPLIYSSNSPDQVSSAQSKFGAEKVSAELDALFAGVAEKLISAGYKRLVVAGGETSGAVAKAVAGALGSPAMRIGIEIDPGVPVLILGDDAAVALALKSGNFGATNFFNKALSTMAGKT